MAKLTDGELIHRSLRDPDLFAEIFAKHHSAVFRFVSTALDRQTAEDIAGEVFLRAFASRHRFDPDYESARPWLYGIASNLVHGHLRRAVRQKRAYKRAGPGGEAELGFEDDVASRIDAANLFPSLGNALASLRTEEAMVVHLYVGGDLAYQDIADILGIPVGTVRSRLSRARLNLRNWQASFDEQPPRDDDE